MILFITLSVIVIFCLSLYIRLKISFPKRLTTEKIALTALIPIHNELKNLDQILININLLLDQQLAVIIVDDGSTDLLIPILEERLNHPDLHFFSIQNQGKYSAILSALKKEVTTSHFLMIDADVNLSKTTLTALQTANIKYDWVQTGIIHEKPKNIIQSFTFIDQILLQKTAFITMNLSRSIIGIGACSRIKKSHYITLFENQSIRYGGDMLIINTTSKKNQLMLSPSYDITTKYLANFKNLVQQRKRWALNNKNSVVNVTSILGTLFWGILLSAFPICLAYSTVIGSINSMLLLLPILGSFLLFLEGRITSTNILSFINYLIFGWLFYIIILFLITFGQFQKQRS